MPAARPAPTARRRNRRGRRSTGATPGIARRAAALAAALVGALVGASARAQTGAGAPPPRGGAPVTPLAAVTARQTASPELLRDTFRVAGRAVIAAGVLQPAAIDVAIDDGTGGLRVFMRRTPGATGAPAVRRGDSVEARGVLFRFRGAVELLATELRVVPAPPRDVPALPLSGLRLGPADEGRLVEVTGVAGDGGTSEGGRWLVLRDALGRAATVWVSDTHAALGPLAATLERVRRGDRLVVTGIVDAFQDTPGDTVVWQVMPRAADDVRIAGAPGAWSARARQLALAPLALAACAAPVGWLLARRAGGRRRRALERAAAEAEARYAQLLALVPLPALVHAEGAVVAANPAADRALGDAPGDAPGGRPLVGRALRELALPAPPAARAARRGRLRGGGGRARAAAAGRRRAARRRDHPRPVRVARPRRDARARPRPRRARAGGRPRRGARERAARPVRAGGGGVPPRATPPPGGRRPPAGAGRPRRSA
jgi:DNA/RNA endonuclease YhcR with UshA esterase domain